MEKEIKTNTYEISFLVNAAEDSEVIKKHLAAGRAEILNEGPVSSIRLAYPIKKQETAFFGYIHFKMDAKEIASLNYALGLDPKVLRFLIVTPIPQKPKPRTDAVKPPRKAASAKDLSNEALEEKLAALQSNV